MIFGFKISTIKIFQVILFCFVTLSCKPFFQTSSEVSSENSDYLSVRAEIEKLDELDSKILNDLIVKISKIKDQMDRAKLVVAIIEVYGFWRMPNRDQLVKLITSPQARIFAAEAFITKGLHQRVFKQFPVTIKARIDIAKSLIEKGYASKVSEHFDEFNIPVRYQKEIIDIASRCVGHFNDSSVLDEIDNFEVSFDLLSKQAENRHLPKLRSPGFPLSFSYASQKVQTAMARNYFRLGMASIKKDLYAFGNLGYLQKDDNIRRLLLRRYNSLGLIVSELFLNGVGNDPYLSDIEDVAKLENLQAILEDGYEGFYRREHIVILNDTFRDLEMAKKLFGLIPTVEFNSKVKVTSSRQIVALSSGIDETLFKQTNYSSTALRNIYSELLDIQTQLDTPAFKGVKIDPNLLEDKSLARFEGVVSRLRNLFLMREIDTDASWIAILDKFGIRQTGITAQNAEQISSQIEATVVQSVKEKFAKVPNLNFDYGHIETLGKLWGNLDPIFTLASRFAGRVDWQPEIDVLGRVFKAVINNSFEALKFYGDSSVPEDVALARKQLYNFTIKSQRESWIKERVTVSNLNKDGISNAAIKQEFLKSFRDTLNTSLFPHTQLQGGVTKQNKLVKNAIALKLIDAEHLSEQLNASISEIWQTLISSLSSLDDPQEIKKISQILQFAMLQNAPVPAEMSDQVSGDLIDIESRAQSIIKSLNSNGSSQEGVVVTLFTHDPKTLLTVGDLVQTTSCQNYKCGSHIQSLLGYVLDANVKVMVSYLAEQKHFNSVQDYQLVRHWINQRKAVVVTFDSGSKTIKFTFAGHTITSKPIEYALRRNIIKVGKSSRRVSLFMERAYTQNDTVQGVLEKQHNEMLDNLAKEMKATMEGNISFPESRNSGGVYSDANGGIEKLNYMIKKVCRASE